MSENLKCSRAVLERHASLDDLLRRSEHPFVSDWNGSNPFYDSVFSERLLDDSKDGGTYVYLDGDEEILREIQSFHVKADRMRYEDEQIWPGSGSSPLLCTFCLWLIRNDIKEVYYIPPMYFALHYFFELFGIYARPITGSTVWSENCQLNLPDRRCVLLLTDPIWFAGTPIPEPVIAAVDDWQRATGSIILVDGSFQYMRWDGTHLESTSRLDPQRTFRLICPTKALAVHDIRFAYLLLPGEEYHEISAIYSNLQGSAPRHGVLLARRAMHQMNTTSSNHQLTSYLKEVFNLSRDRGVFEAWVPPSCGYFVFARMKEAVAPYIGMDESYFETRGYPGYVRINLLGIEKFLSL